MTTRGRSSSAFAHNRPFNGWSRCAGDVAYDLFHYMLFLCTLPYSPEDFRFHLEAFLLTPVPWRSIPYGFPPFPAQLRSEVSAGPG